MTREPDSKSFPYMWLIPVVMLVMAMLACDDVIQPSVMVDRVEADPTVDGKVYATLINVDNPDSSDSMDVLTVAYETSDHGASWQRSDHRFADPPVKSAYTTEWYGEQLMLNGYGVWSFPRPIFRSVFYDGTTVQGVLPFDLPEGSVNNAVQGNTIYIAAGTQGVLVAHFDDRGGLASDWKISSQGMDALQPLRLSITDPFDILFVIALILIVPPFALIHRYLLSRVWLYILPPAEASSMAWKVTLGLVAAGVIGAIFWLTSDRVDLYEVLAVLTALIVIVGVTVTVLLAQKADVTDGTRNRLALAALVVSLVVPIGVAAIFAMWWFVFGVVFVYWAFQRVFWRYIQYDGLTPEGRVQRWRVDRLAIELVIIIAVGLGGIALQIVLFQTILYRARFDYGLIQLLALALAIGGLYFVIRHYSSGRARGILKLDADTRQGRPLQKMSRDMWVNSLYWFILTVVATALTLFAQAMTYTWFTTLLKTTVSR